MKQIELTEKLNRIKKQRLNPIKDLSMFLKLYFKNIKIFKGELFVRPALTFCLIMFLFSSVGVYSYNSSSVVYGNNLYGIKTGIENKILASKKNQEEKINYYAKLIDRRILELKYLENKNFNTKELSFNIINIVYADDVNKEKYSSSIANTMLMIVQLNEKIKVEFENIKDENIKQRVNKIIEEKKIQQETIFLEIENKNNLLIKKQKINKNISNEIESVLLKQKKDNLNNQKENILENNKVIDDSNNNKNINKKEDIKENDDSVNKEKQEEKKNGSNRQKQNNKVNNINKNIQDKQEIK